MRDLLVRLVVAAERIADALTTFAEHRSKPQGAKRRAKTLENRRREVVEKIKPTEMEIARAKRILRDKS